MNKGYSFQEVAINMNITYKTVTTHKYLIMRKFCLRNDYDLFRFFRQAEPKKRNLIITVNASTKA
ncbi:hypothetical protein IE994_13315 [Enterobacter hormaechei]|nr:hypothetical protein [Enterobacter hormaechei]